MALTRWQPPALRHDVDDDGRVTWLELFFDLIYVAALIQLGDRLSGDVTIGGAFAFIGAFAVLWWTWTGTTAFMNRFAVDDVAHRVLMFVQMFAVGNVAVLAAGTPDNWSQWLAVAYVIARLPLLAMYARVRRSMPETRRLVDLYLACFGGSAGLWALSILVPEPVRYVLWALGLALEFAAPVIGATRRDAPPTHGEHFQERYALFTIIVLGETFVKTLTEVTEIGVSRQSQVFGSIAFVILIALWWTYFDDVADARIRAVSRLSPSAPVNRLLWVYTHLPLAAGLTAFGVAAKKIVAVDAFGEAFRSSYTWLTVAALALSLLAVAVLDLVTASPHFAIEQPARVLPRVVAAVALIPIGVLLATGAVGALVGLALVAAIVTIQIAVEVVAAARSEHRLSQDVRATVDGLAGTCEHLQSRARPAADGPTTCKVCDEKGVAWVQLRLCLTCGFVGCCDDSPGRHASAHHHESGHPTILTLEPGDDWAYCFDDDVTVPGWSSGSAQPDGLP